MTQTLAEFDEVRVIATRTPPGQHLAISTAQRAPQVGDIGTVVDVRHDGPHAVYVVEDVTTSGQTVWLAEFSREELELVRPGTR